VFERNLGILRIEFLAKQDLSPKYESDEQILFGVFGKYKKIKNLCGILENPTHKQHIWFLPTRKPNT
jgi:hypothetical protein